MKSLSAVPVLVALMLIVSAIAGAREPRPVVLTFDPATKHQTMEAWGIVLPCWTFDAWVRAKPEDAMRVYDEQSDKSELSDVLGQAQAAEMVERGFTRVRLEVGPQVEMVNDNDDPKTIDWKAFRFKWQDILVKEQLLPMKRLIEARGEKILVYVSYDLRSSRTPEWLLQPDEYAEMAVAMLTYLKKTYGLEPKYWSVINEPGHNRPGDPKLYARLTAATGKRIAEAGFKTRMSGPEVVTPGLVDRYMKAMEETPGALDHFAQLTYHLYGAPDTISNRETIRRWARKLKITAAQTEWMDQTNLDVARHIWLCLTVADAVTWERYTWDIDTDVKSNSLKRKKTAWYVRQFSRFIRPGSVRVEMATDDRIVRPVAYLSPKGKPVLVLLNLDERHLPATINGLPAGTYKVSFTNWYAAGQSMPDMAIEEGKPLEIKLPPRAAVTLTADPPPPGPEGAPPGGHKK